MLGFDNDGTEAGPCTDIFAAPTAVMFTALNNVQDGATALPATHVTIAEALGA